MKIITIASDPQFPGLQQLKRSLEKFGYEYDVMIEPFQFGRQMKTIYQWCKANWGWFLYTDAYDSVALGGELMKKFYKLSIGTRMLISAEKACYPEVKLLPLYPQSKFEWRFVNGGGFMTTCDYFVNIYEDGTHQDESNDQTWLSEQFLKRPEIELDYGCEIFQTIAFEGAGDFSYNGRLINNLTKSEPVFIHGNGHTSMKHIYSLLDG